MKVLVINPIMYTSETKIIKRATTIKDTMMYDFCLAFYEAGHEVVLFCGEPYKPCRDENYPFEVRWGKCVFQKLFVPNCFPLMPEVSSYIKDNENKIGLIISSEVFSINTLLSYWAEPIKLITWHELAKHNSIMKRLPSKIWYNIVARFFMNNMRVVARSKEARLFISKYCYNTSESIIDHGVNLNKFEAVVNKKNFFVVCSQLIDRKRIDGIIEKFKIYVDKFDSFTKLYIIGDGEMNDELKRIVIKLELNDSVYFKGKLNHQELLPFLASAKAMLVNTVKDNNMVSIIESIAVGTPVVTTDIPLNSDYVKEYRLGIAKRCWDEVDLNEIVSNNKYYVKNCLEYRDCLSTKNRVAQFLKQVKIK